MLYKILVFDSTHTVMKAEKTLLGSFPGLSIIPTPKEFSSSCGISIRVPADQFIEEGIHSLLTAERINYRVFEKEMK